MAMGFMNKFKNKLETYAIIIQTLENVVLETVASYKQGHCLGRKNLLPRHLFKISVSFKARFLGFVFVQYTPSFT